MLHICTCEQNVNILHSLNMNRWNDLTWCRDCMDRKHRWPVCVHVYYILLVNLFSTFFWGGTYLSCRCDIFTRIDNILPNCRLDYCILKCSIFGEYFISCLSCCLLSVLSFLVNKYVIFNKTIFHFSWLAKTNKQ